MKLRLTLKQRQSWSFALGKTADVVTAPLCNVGECPIEIREHCLKSVVSRAKMHCVHMHLQHTAIDQQSFTG